MGARLFPAVHGHIADRVRDHEPVQWRITGIARGAKAERGFTEPLAQPISMASHLGEELADQRRRTLVCVHQIQHMVMGKQNLE